VDPKGNIPAWVTNMFKVPSPSFFVLLPYTVIFQTKAAKSVLALRNYVIANPPK
jgi:hypothetical protein